MILVDTSVWIDFFADKPLIHVEKLVEFIYDDREIVTCGIVLTEVLQGIQSDKEFTKTKALFTELLYLPMRQSTFLKSAEIYRKLRKNGVTIRKSLDCMIASLVLENDIFLLDNDRDFDPIENHFGIKRVSLG